MKLHHRIQAHIKQHHKKYIGGLFAGFAVVKTFVLLAGFLGLAGLSNTFAAGNELNSGNIAEAPYYCGTGAASCYLANKNIVSIAPNTFVNHPFLQQIDLNTNQISTISADAFTGLTGLVGLDLSSNQITVIESGAFAGLPRMIVLNLQANNLTGIDAGTFAGLTGLATLNISYNQIASIQNSAFVGLTRLAFFNLQANNLTVIDSGTFAGLTALSLLGLNINQIATIESGAFVGLTNLNALQLNNNKIISIGSGIFAGPNNLQHLNLSYNQITTIESGTFVAFHILNDLYLDNNDIATIQSGAFSGLTHVITLQLSKNDIVTIESGAFVGLDSLNDLYLNYNLLSSLPEDTTILTTLIGPGGLRLDNNCRDITAMSTGLIDFLDTKAVGYAWKTSINPACPMPDIAVTFNVNMNRKISDGSFTTGTDVVIIRGDFEGAVGQSNWAGDFFVMTDPEGDGIYSRVVNIPANLSGTLYQYKFLINQNRETGDNRSFTLIGPSMDLYAFWYSNELPMFSCADIIDVPQSECTVLSGLYHSTNGSGWTNQSNWFSGTTVEDWYGVTVSGGHISEISLSNNNLSGTINFAGLTHLEQLSLSKNTITAIESGAFAGLTNLTILDLQSNNLTVIDSSTFAGLTSLNSLKFDSNQVILLETGIFSGLINLQTLSISHNLITTIDAGTFAGLSNLQTLIISSNQITLLETGIFSGLINLQALIISSNQITAIDAGVFAGLTSLTSLSINNNLITSIDAGTFAGLTNLDKLDLGMNHIATLAENFIYLTSLGTANGLNIYDNYINYHNLSVPLLDFIDTKHVTRLGDWRLRQTFVDDYNCGNATCESAGYCALQNQNMTCSNMSGLACANGCGIQTTTQSCAGNIKCSLISDSSTCTQYSCGRDAVNNKCSDVGTTAKCVNQSVASCPTTIGCFIESGSPICTGTFHPSTITQQQCGTIYSGNWLTEDINSCPVDCASSENSGGLLFTTTNGTGNLLGLIFSQTQNMSGVISGDILTYTFDYQNTSSIMGHYGVMIKEYLPMGLHMVSSSTSGGYVDHQMTYGGQNDICLQQLLQSTGAYYDALETLVQGAFGQNGYNVVVASNGYTGTEAELGQYFYDNICVAQGYPNIQDCFNMLNFQQNPAYDYFDIASLGEACGERGDLLQNPYYYRYIGYMGTGQSGTISFSAQADSTRTGGQYIQNRGVYSINKIWSGYNHSALGTPTSLINNLNILIIPVYDLQVTKTLIGLDSYLPGAQLSYQIKYTNIGNMPLTGIRISESPGIGLSLIDFASIFSGGWEDRIYGSTGDICYDNLLNETGIYMDSLYSWMQTSMGRTGSVYEFMLDFAGTTSFLSPPYNSDASLIGEYLVNMFTQGGTKTFASGMKDSIGVDIPTLDTSCGTGGKYYYTASVPDLQVGQSGSLITLMQIASTLSGGAAVENSVRGTIYHTGEINTGNNMANVFVIVDDLPVDNGSGSQTTGNVSQPTIGGGGGGSLLVRDVCPAQRDCSDSYYDLLCGKCSILEKAFDVLPFHSSANAQSGSIAHSPFSFELNDAYLRAYEYGITTMPTIQKANMQGLLSRKDMAKIITNFAVNVLGKDISTGVICKFSDMDSFPKETQYYAIAACRLGLMGYESDGTAVKRTFDPKKIIDRAQFGTILSRLVRGQKYNGGKIYYQKHLEALKKEGIMTKIDTPFANEMRGRVMVMMQRIFEK